MVDGNSRGSAVMDSGTRLKAEGFGKDQASCMPFGEAELDRHVLACRQGWTTPTTAKAIKLMIRDTSDQTGSTSYD